MGAILGETADSLTHQVDSIFNEAFTGNASKEGLSNYKYGNKDGKYFISFDFANAENTEIGVQFSKNGNKISVNFDKMKELFDSMNEKESVDNSGMDMSAMFQYTAIFNFDKKVASVTGVDAEITGKKTVKVPIKINSFPKGDVIITLK